MITEQPQTPALLSGLTDLTKKQLTERAHLAVATLNEEGGDVLALTAIATKVKHFATELEKAGKAAGLGELDSFGRAGTAKQGVQLKVKDAGVTYDYSADPVWIRLNGEINAAKGKIAEWEELLKKIPYEGQSINDPDTGEVYTARKPIRTAKSTIEATIL